MHVDVATQVLAVGNIVLTVYLVSSIPVVSTEVGTLGTHNTLEKYVVCD